VIQHILRPRAGLPAEPVWRTVSVAAASCVDASTASTAAIIKGRTAISWLTSQGLAARLVAADGTVHVVAGWPPDPPAPGQGDPA
jgi:thiamine biosynthesis lipoprotein